jgi:hypothetical protein
VGDVVTPVGRTDIDPRHALPRWAQGYVQRVDPQDVQASSSLEGGGAKGWGERNTIDIDDTQDGRAWTSWVSGQSGRATWLKYTFPVAVRLAYVRFHNGLGTDDDPHTSRIRTARLTTDHGSYEVLFPRYRTLFTYLCDMGPTTHLKLEVESAYEARASIALSQVEFWGRAANAASGRADPSTTGLPLLQRIGRNPPTARYVERCRTAPAPASVQVASGADQAELEPQPGTAIPEPATTTAQATADPDQP